MADTNHNDRETAERVAAGKESAYRSHAAAFRRLADAETLEEKRRLLTTSAERFEILADRQEAVAARNHR